MEKNINYNVHNLSAEFLHIKMQNIYEKKLFLHLLHPWISRNYFFLGGRPQEAPLLRV